MCVPGLVCAEARLTLSEGNDYRRVAKEEQGTVMLGGGPVKLTKRGAGKLFDMWQHTWSKKTCWLDGSGRE